ncbi:MAG: hypothetical protein CME19_14245 [Gemmatimonadetes bacterium]|nr:hypothetical protein [Gemmatimonadota bacterium]
MTSHPDAVFGQSFLDQDWGCGFGGWFDIDFDSGNYISFWGSYKHRHDISGPVDTLGPQLRRWDDLPSRLRLRLEALSLRLLQLHRSPRESGVVYSAGSWLPPEAALEVDGSTQTRERL